MLILRAYFCLRRKDIIKRIFSLSSKSLRRSSENIASQTNYIPTNGTPFGSVSAIQRYTRQSYRFIEPGIDPVYSDPARPDQNGRHERMHRDLKAACAKLSAFDLNAQQRTLNRFVKEYNHVRTHESLGVKTPSDCHDFLPDHALKKSEIMTIPPQLK